MHPESIQNILNKFTIVIFHNWEKPAIENP